ncbi:MAG: hypothetical protein GY845_29430 [Planctomycetes bacterium]|nr:hypothetical protein [Planctomycetota bacterium]
MSITYNLYAIRSPLYAVLPSTTVENSLQITPYLKKQTQFQKCKVMQAQYIQGITKRKADSCHEKTNPIQTQFKPKIINYKGLNISSNKLEWISFVKNSCIPEMEDNASEQKKSLLGVSK